MKRNVLERLTAGTWEWAYSVQGSGPPVVLIHGLSGSVGWWRRNIPVFAEYFTVYAVALHGFAGNRRGRPLGPRGSGDALAAFMDGVEIERAHVVGHSMGGHISIHLASMHPACVDRLVLAAPSGLLRRGLVTMAMRVARSSRYGAPDFAPTIMADALRAGPLNLLLAARQLLKDDVQETLAAIHAPTLVVAGERDVIVPPDVCRGVADGIAGATYSVLEGAGHNLMWDRAAAFNELVLGFLRAEGGKSG